MIRKIYLIHHTHFDIGFTDLAKEVIQKQVGYLSDAVRLCEADPDYHWTIECGSLLRNWMSSQNEKTWERIVKLLRSGQMELGGFDMQMLTETASFSELYANVSRPARLGKEYGFPVECAILDDIGGFCCELPRMMNEAGLRYLICGVGACQAELPWAKLPHLFYLTSRSGGKILVWNLGIDRTEKSCESMYPYAVYGLGASFLGYWGMLEFLEKRDMGIVPQLTDGHAKKNPASTEEAFQILIYRLEKEMYPYEYLLLQYGGDNREPCPDLAELVRKLNASGRFPEICFTTPSVFMRKAEQKYGNDIPVLSGFLTDPWNLRMNAVPSVLKRFRSAQRNYEYLRLKGITDSVVQENLMLCSDHTFGLNNWGWHKLAANLPDGIRSQNFDRMRQSWADKRHYAEAAYQRSLDLVQQYISGVDLAEKKAVVVANTSLHTVSGSAELYLGSYAPIIKGLCCADGGRVPFQKIGLNRYVLDLKNVPALGKIRITPEFSGDYEGVFTPVPAKVPAEIKTDFYTCQFSADGTLLSISDFTNGPFGDFELEKLFDIDEVNEHCNLQPIVRRETFHLTETVGALVENGELFLTICKSGKCGNSSVDIRFRLWKHHPRIDVKIRLDVPETSEKTCYRINFPFAGEGGNWLFDQNAGIADPAQLLPGAVQEFFFCARYFMLNGNDYSAVVCCPDAPVAELGDSRAAQWGTKLPYKPANNHFSGLIGNNLTNTDSPSWFQLRDSFSYSVFLTQKAQKAEDAQECWETTTALYARLSYEAEETSSALGRALRAHIGDDGCMYSENLTNGRLDRHIRWSPPDGPASADGSARRGAAGAEKLLNTK